MNFKRLFVLICLMAPGHVWPQAPAASEVDPYESFNRSMFALNENLDKYMIKPVAQGYRYVTPDVVQRGVGNFFANLWDLNAMLNALLQGKPRGAAQAGGRFLVNSTLGVLGLIDTASKMGIRPHRADFGQTLAVWGLEPGPYLMVPFFGPRTVRSGVGTIVDVYAVPQSYIEQVRVRNSLYGLSLVDGRARLLDAEELITGDRYIFVRDAYLQQRAFFVNDGVVEDDFSDFGDDVWEEEF
jgi:phospholipid-binding lipoprotein MlaA